MGRGGQRINTSLVHLGVAAILGAASMATVGLAHHVGADGGGTSSALVPITPCRLLDTRPAPDNVGTRSTPIAAGETYAATVWGTNGNCTIPAGATALSMNVTIINPTKSSFLTAYPTDAPRPLTAALVWNVGQAATPNAVTATTSADGHIGFYNLAGTVDLAVDVVGYYLASTSGPTGPQGATGPAGPQGPAGAPAVDPANIRWVAKAGTGTYPSVNAALASINDAGPTNPYTIEIAPGTYDETSTGPTRGIDMKPYVSLHGSGADVTNITCSCATNDATTSRMLRIASPGSALSDLTVDNVGGPNGFFATAVAVSDATGTTVLDHVHVMVGDAYGPNNDAPYSNVVTGIVITGAAPTLRTVEVDVDPGRIGGIATGISASGGSSPSMTDVLVHVAGSGDTASGISLISSNANGRHVEIDVASTVSATGWSNGSGGAGTPGSSPTVHDLTVSATSSGASATGIANGLLSGPTMADVTVTATAGGSGTAIGVANNGAVPSSLTGGSITASGGSDAKAIADAAGSPSIRDVTATASGASGTNTGVYGTGGTPVLRNVVASATGGTQARGIVNFNLSNLTMDDVTASGGTGPTDWGLDNNGTGAAATISSSRIAGTNFSVVTNATGGSIRIVNSTVNLPITGTSTKSCVGVVKDGSNVPLDAGCA